MSRLTMNDGAAFLDERNEEIGFPNHTTLIDLLEAQVLKTPDQIAIIYQENSITYKELNRNINRLARYLIRQGVKKGHRVCIALNRDIAAIEAIFAVLKCGAAYIPIDPEYPFDRIRFMAEDADAHFLITTTAFSGIFHTPATEIVLDQVADVIKTFPAGNPDVQVKGDDLMYILYTSGSTGTPKGAMICHRNMMHFLKGMSEEYKVNSTFRTLTVYSISFDPSGGDYYLTLTNGATLIIADTATVKDGQALLKLIISEKVNFLTATPSVYKLLLSGGWTEKLPITICSGGEPLSKNLADNLLGKCSLLYNVYGPTETTITATQIPITNSDVITIGYPLADTPVYILNEHQQPVQPGETGELYISGNGVGLGYFKRDDLTKERFIPDPFSAVEGQKMYRTGDLVKQDAEGRIVYVGRLDNQVKIRGYRIETGEIEHRLMQLEYVKECLVLAKENREGEKVLIAYAISEQRGISPAQRISSWRNVLYQQLPEFMVPAYFFILNTWPLLPNGKIDYAQLPGVPVERPELTVLYQAPKTGIEKALAQLWSEILDIAGIGLLDNFFELGGNSLLAQKMVSRLSIQQDIHLPVTAVYESPTITGLVSLIQTGQQYGRALTGQPSKTDRGGGIAVIGMATRLPGVDSVEQFWEVLKNGVETISFFTDEALAGSVSDADKNNPDYVKARGVLKDIESFDAALFGINPKLGELMDPQQRVFLELCRDVLEKTGYLVDHGYNSIGVYAGCSSNTYYENNVIWHKDKIEHQGAFQVTSVSDKDYIASRVAFHLNLKGPAVNVNSACSTSLLAVAQAVESLRKGQCEMALAGGASIHVPVNSGHIYEEGSIFSKDGHTRTFDAAATGTVFSDGAGVVLLKREEDALRDGDIIYAVIRGVGVNNDGGNKGSFSAPSAQGQAAAIRMAMEDAAVAPSTVSYIEAHGTATPLGDPIEIEGLKMAFGRQEKKAFCAIGSVKSNIGHATHAAGIAGLIKTVLALYYRQIPPSINFAQPNPLIRFEDTPFRVNSKLADWERDQTLIAGVSSFGVGGTNVHVIVQEAVQAMEVVPQKEDNQKEDGPQLIAWSARAPESVIAYAAKLKDFLQSHPYMPLQDVAYSLHASRPELAVRNYVVAKDVEELIVRLSDTKAITASANHIKEKKANVVFLFPGQGNQYLNMGRELYTAENVYREAVDQCAVLLQEYMGEDIREIIFADENDHAAAEKLKNTRYAQPAIFTTAYSLAKLYISWGVTPVAFAGHSVGEFVGAHLAGIFSLGDVLKIVAERGRLISGLPAGSMLSVRASQEKIKELLPLQLSIAAQNATELCVVSGETEAIQDFAKKLDEEGMINKPLRTSHAFHSAMMEPIISPLKAVIEKVSMHIPQLPVMSTVTAAWLKDDEATSATYWAKHARETVQFGSALKKIQQDMDPVFLEAGPGTSSAIFVKQNGIGNEAFSALSDRLAGEVVSAKNALGKLWQYGAEIDWMKRFGKERYHLLHSLPTYAYNKKYLWVPPPGKPVAPLQSVTPLQNIAETITRSIPPEIEMKRKEILLTKLKDFIESVSGIPVMDANPQSNFAELGLDSLLLTQLATSLKKEFALPVTFRQLSEDYDSLDKLAEFYDTNLPDSMFNNNNNVQPVPASANMVPVNPAVIPQAGGDMLSLMSMQLQLLTQQMAMMQQGVFGTAATGGNNHQAVVPQHAPVFTDKNTGTNAATDELTVEEKVELKKPFGATARIEKSASELSEQQQQYINGFITAYNKKTAESKKYTQQHRARMADPRVVSGFRPYTKEMVYSIVTKKSKGCYLWDIDGNKYIDALNGFGSNFLGYQPDFVKEAILQQVEDGYEIGPQHVLAGEVSDLICELTGMERAALCNTGSEAVLGAMRIARTVTGRDIVVAFAGSYHGIMDEVLVRGSKKLKTYPAASGILADNVQNMLILEYGSEESLKIIKERAAEIAAVLVEPVQSRRPEFQPVAFLKELRKVTAAIDVALIFDEVITGFRSHLGGTQALFGIKADIATYGKVAGAGISIGIIAGSKNYMDALDGGYWEYGDRSIPEVGVTYFAGTFVRHPLALATTKASLTYLKSQGPGLQKEMNEKTDKLVARLNQIAQKHRAPVYVVHFSSLWKIKFKEEYPYYELLFALMRFRNIHIWDLFPCFLTIAHTREDIDAICVAFEESIIELCRAGFMLQKEAYSVAQKNGIKVIDNSMPPVPGARLGKDKNGNPAWFAPDGDHPGKYLQISLSDK
ncbi:MAG: amino acid adenylation domain-containing protein [Niabella sp.]